MGQGRSGYYKGVSPEVMHGTASTFAQPMRRGARPEREREYDPGAPYHRHTWQWVITKRMWVCRFCRSEQEKI